MHFNKIITICCVINVTLIFLLKLLYHFQAIKGNYDLPPLQMSRPPWPPLSQRDGAATGSNAVNKKHDVQLQMRR